LITITIDRTKIRRARETRCVKNRQLSSPTIPPPAPPPCAGTSGDRPDLPADDWTAPSTAEPVAAAAIVSVVGSFAGAGAATRSEAIASSDNKRRKTDVRPAPTRGGCQPQDEHCGADYRTVSHDVHLFCASQPVDLAAIRRNPTTKLAPHPPNISSFHRSFLPFLPVPIHQCADFLRAEFRARA
jgi:hypothetical protein